ncbi:MAG TPA: uroporphyrinogen-III synthase, partial [Fibrobacteraceae bacterium]|nr:uroporphyrinogen-III synthase [Fibrobacteraceae bacterium]
LDWITFASSSTVESFIQVLGTRHPIPASCRVACIGPVTAKTARQNGLTVHAEAKEFTLDGLIQALLDSNSSQEVS